MMTTNSAEHLPTVFLVDDDPGVLRSVTWLVEAEGMKVAAFSSGAELLAALPGDRSGCVVTDYRMPDMTGLELHENLRSKGILMPLIVVTGYGDVATCSRAFRDGVLDFLEKPVSNQVLLARIREALRVDQEIRSRPLVKVDISERLAKLTPREREVMDRLVVGRSMKQIAVEFEVSIQTASKHRMRVLEKLKVGNDIELVRLFLASQVVAAQ